MADVINAMLFANEQYVSRIKILNIGNDGALTVLPKSRNFLFDFFNDDLTVSYEHGDFFYRIRAAFDDVKVVNSKHYFLLKPLKKSSEYLRKKKSFQNKQIIFFSSGQSGTAALLKLSENGMQICSNYPIENKIIEIWFSANGYPKSFFGETVWRDRKNNKYYYGLRLIRNEVV